MPSFILTTEKINKEFIIVNLEKIVLFFADAKLNALINLTKILFFQLFFHVSVVPQQESQLNFMRTCITYAHFFGSVFKRIIYIEISHYIDSHWKYKWISGAILQSSKSKTIGFKITFSERDFGLEDLHEALLNQSDEYQRRLILKREISKIYSDNFRDSLSEKELPSPTDKQPKQKTKTTVSPKEKKAREQTKARRA